ncbi:MAG: P-II family nitrogen regulator [Candidatus Nanopelagicales bacterium]|nr:P-II family nitrogen regulator [Candidatus Nanopelagicales bacterium]MDZ4249397.1 P-II family nitrogen regulator [Candidatus Nanopelagicales bacterium]MDZ7577663.1 P-II family nitrogen regulator [Candidatus Nanopelagicales bacterium]
MQLISMVVKPQQLDDLKNALEETGISSMTVWEVYGRQRGPEEQTYRGAAVQTYLVPRMRVEVVVPDEHADSVLEVMSRSVNGGTDADDVIAVMQTVLSHKPVTA